MGTDTSIEAVRKLFEETRLKLVETGTRNRLIHVNRANNRANVLAVINERSDDIYRILVSKKATMRFLATGQDDTEESDTPKVTTDETPEELAARYADNQLETRLGPEGLRKRLLKIAREAQTIEEEQGVNILFLALGFLTWFEDDKSEVQREAPLILLPVELARNHKTGSFEIRSREEEIPTNLPLEERLSRDFGVALPSLVVDEEWAPSDYFSQVEATISGKSRWKVDRDGMQLGFFSFAKLLMFRDLDPTQWPGNALEKHSLTRGLLYERFAAEEPLFGKDDRLDEQLPPENLYHVVDADSSQAKVIEEVRNGRNLVVQGPPGTGKSQTITNIIAAAVQDGKRVLFVAEKMAALSVVYRRLVAAGLRDVCLELHSKSANKKSVLDELRRTLNEGSAIPSVPKPPTALRTARDKLNAIATDLHRPVGKSDATPFTAVSEQIAYRAKSAPAPKIPVDALVELSDREVGDLAAGIEAYAAAIQKAGPLADHPYVGVGAIDLQPTDVDRLPDRLAPLATAVAGLATLIAEVGSAVGKDAVPTALLASELLGMLDGMISAPQLDPRLLERMVVLSEKARLREILTQGSRWVDARNEAKSTWTDAAWNHKIAQLRPALAAGQASFFARWGSAYRGASRELAGLLRGNLPKSAADRTALVDGLLAVATLQAAWQRDASWCSEIVGEEWRGERTDFEKLLQVVAWAEQLAAVPGGINPPYAVALALDEPRREQFNRDLRSQLEIVRPQLESWALEFKIEPVEALQSCDLTHASLAVVEQKIRSLAAQVERYEEWVTVCELRSRLQAARLHAPLVEELSAGRRSGSEAADEVRYARAEAVWKRAIAASQGLASLRSIDRHALVSTFQRLEADRRGESVQEIRSRHLAQLPQGALGAMGFIRGELGKKKAHAPIRKLFTEAGEAIQRIKPVLMMSPISVAQFLPPAALEFDMLLIDEASQVRPEDALGAIARARQIVVVGDQKQLPPSSFFDRISGGADAESDEDEETEALLEKSAKVGELESILTLCEARGLTTRMLEWHYRSRDPSLIRVSNREFYGDRLILPPSPLEGDPGYGLSLTRVDGVYDRGGKRDNRIEAEAVVRRVAEHARTTPTVSVGIVTFSVAQRNLITELLEFSRREDSVLDRFLREGKTEDIFVKNIENVQGDERDVILVSIGYGPSVVGGKPPTGFGPVNNEGGGRRLNVLFTRARMRCEVFCSFNPSDMDLSKNKGDGPRILKQFLEFAKTKILDEKLPTGRGADTPFESDVANEMRRLGYQVDHQVGTGGFVIDLGVRHPERPSTYLLAVECDGATYHSALWARERDRLRQQVLEHLGWRFHRVWSTDWFYRRSDEIARLRAALEAARSATQDGLSVTGANSDEAMEPEVEVEPVSSQSRVVADVLPQRVMPPYEKAKLRMHSGEPHEAPSRVLVALVRTVVEAEGPVHIEEISRRIASAFGKEKTGQRIQAVTLEALQAASADGTSFVADGEFWMTKVQSEDVPVRDRSLETTPTNKLAYISDRELQRALTSAREDMAGGEDEEIVKAAARLLGFKRLGSDLQDRLSGCLVATKR